MKTRSSSKIKIEQKEKSKNKQKSIKSSKQQDKITMKIEHNLSFDIDLRKRKQNEKQISKTATTKVARDQQYRGLRKWMKSEGRKIGIKIEIEKKDYGIFRYTTLLTRLESLIGSFYNTQTIDFLGVKRLFIGFFYFKPIRYFNKVKQITKIFQFVKNSMDFFKNNASLVCQQLTIWLSKLINLISNLILPSQQLNTPTSLPKKKSRKISEKRDQIQIPTKRQRELTNNEKDQKQKICICSPVELKVQGPQCPNSECGNKLQDIKCPKANHCMIICPKCRWDSHKCPTKSKVQFTTKLKMKANGCRVDDFPVLSISSRNDENNIKEVVARQKYQFTRKQMLIVGIPDLISKYPILIGKARDTIYQNRQKEGHLSLWIKQSIIKGAGLGVFATKDFNYPDMLVCSYLGQIGLGSLTPNYRNDHENDSIFTLGWIGSQILIMAPNKYSNVGRYINYNKPENCNLKPNLCLLQRGQNDYEIAVFLTTTRKIKAGEELFYCYGPYYQTK